MLKRCDKVWVWDGITKCRGIVMAVKPNGNTVISYNHPNGIGEVTGREFTPTDIQKKVSKMERKDYLVNP